MENIFINNKLKKVKSFIKDYIKIISLIIIFILLIPINVLANDNVNIYVFHSESCIHCKHALTYLNELDESRNDINLHTFEVSKDINAYNRNLYNKAMETLEIKINSVPFIIIGNSYYVGFDDSDKETFVNAINYYKNHNYRDMVGVALELVEDNGYENLRYEKEFKISVPLIGEVNLSDLSLPVISIIMGFVDGFNPCAMWILLFLITMLFNMKDKKKMWILGLTFIGTSAFIYFLFMMAWLKTSDFMNSIKTLQLIVGIFSIIFGSFNLYKYFKERKEDGCTVIKKEKRKLVFGYIKKVIENKYFILALIGIMTLAVIVNLIELLCSLGLPVMFTEILSLNHLSSNIYFTYIGLYILFFMLDDIIIFTLSMVTLKSKAISTKYNKYSHLIGGIIMLIIGLLIILKPEWLAFSFN